MPNSIPNLMVKLLISSSYGICQFHYERYTKRMLWATVRSHAAPSAAPLVRGNTALELGRKGKVTRFT
jgi:hypothetical protein